MYIKRRNFIKLRLLGAGAIFPGRHNIAAPPANAHSNIVLILADDFGWGDASCNNPEAGFQTPNIDRIAREGIRFTNALPDGLRVFPPE